MNKAVVLSLGDALRSDLGAGAWVIEALGQEGYGEDVHLEHLGEDPRYMASRLIGTEVAVVVLALGLGREPGRIRDLGLPAFQRLCELERGCHARLCALDLCLRQLAALEVLPGVLRLVVIDCARTDEGLGLSPRVKAAIRPAARRVTGILEAAGVCPDRPGGGKVLTLYRLAMRHEML